MKWRVARSLIALRNQVNEKFPNRNKDWDGTIGDANHASRKSDHNPWVDDGVVTAMDITHDPRHGVDSYEMAEELRQSRDPRIKYIISNRRIASSTTNPWKWRKYTGSNPHDHHVHISVNSQRKYYDDDAPWEIPMLGKVPSERLEVAYEGDDEQSVSQPAGFMSSIESVSDTADRIVTTVKPITRSHISWASVGLGASGVASAASAAPPTLLEQFINIWKSPIWWLVLFNVALTCYILWHYYKDHGRGAVEK